MNEKTVNSDSFKCPSCGGDMRFNPAAGSLKCDFCDREDAINAIGGDIEEYDFNAAETDESLKDWGTVTKTVECENCGGSTVVPVDQTTVACAFCGSPKVVSSEELPGIKPESLVPFRVDNVKAKDHFKNWIKKRWFAPNALKKTLKTDNLNGVYIPYWSYDCDTRSSYNGQAGDYYYVPETYTTTVNGKTETRTRQVRKIRWRFVSGTYDKSFDDIIFNDSGNVEQKMIERLEPFKLNELVQYNPKFLAGFAAERYKSGLKAVWERAKNRISSILRRDITAIIKRSCDVVGMLNISTNYADIKYKHMLLPIWISSYRYKDKVYNFFVNGQTGEVQGKSPKSFWKVSALIAGIIAVGVGIYFLIRQFI